MSRQLLVSLLDEMVEKQLLLLCAPPSVLWSATLFNFFLLVSTIS